MRIGSYLTLAFFVAASIPAFAGGIQCKQCPAESANCLPRPDCSMELNLSNLCPQNSVSDCELLTVGSACNAEGVAGSCRLTPLTAGGFCMCSPDHR